MFVKVAAELVDPHVPEDSDSEPSVRVLTPILTPLARLAIAFPDIVRLLATVKLVATDLLAAPVKIKLLYAKTGTVWPPVPLKLIVLPVVV